MVTYWVPAIRLRSIARGSPTGSAGPTAVAVGRAPIHWLGRKKSPPAVTNPATLIGPPVQPSSARSSSISRPVVTLTASATLGGVALLAVTPPTLELLIESFSRPGSPVVGGGVPAGTLIRLSVLFRGP